MMWDANLPITAVYQRISPVHRIPDYRLHGVMRVCICGIYGLRDYVVAASAKSPAVVAHTPLQPILNVARLASKTCTQGTAKSEGANEQGKILLECVAAMHLISHKGWETLIDEGVHMGGGVEGGCVAGQLWVDVSRKWWTNFSATCVFAWQKRWFTGGDLKRLKEYSIAMGETLL